MNIPTIPTSALLTRKVSVTASCTKEQAFEFISSSTRLAEWLKKSGPVPGAKSVEILEGPYDHPGAARKVIFETGDTAIEQLISYHPFANYSYQISDFSDFLGKLSNAAYGQLWFDQEESTVRITWSYSFSYKNLFARCILSLFLTFVYKKFMRSCLKNAAFILSSTKNGE